MNSVSDEQRETSRRLTRLTVSDEFDKMESERARRSKRAREIESLDPFLANHITDPELRRRTMPRYTEWTAS
jgi:hypothetical protein